METKIARFGTSYGGFYYPVNLLGLNNDSIIYCIGVGEDISHDVAISGQLNSKIFLIDPTPRAISHVNLVKKCLERQSYGELNCTAYGGGDAKYAEYIANSNCVSDNIIYLPYALGMVDGIQKFYKPTNKDFVSHTLRENFKSNDYINVPVKSITSIMEELGHTHIDLLKIDIEGIECDVLNDILNKEILPLYLSVDFDSVKQNKERVRTTCERLQKMGYQKIHGDDRDMSFININNKIFTNN